MKILYAIAVFLLASADAIVAAQVKDDNDGWQVVKSRRDRRNHYKSKQPVQFKEEDVQIAFNGIKIPAIQKIVLSYLTRYHSSPIKLTIPNNDRIPKILFFELKDNPQKSHNFLNSLPWLHVVCSIPPKKYRLIAQLNQNHSGLSIPNFLDSQLAIILKDWESPSVRLGYQRISPTSQDWRECLAERSIDENHLKFTFGKDDPNLAKLRRILFGEGAH